MMDKRIILIIILIGLLSLSVVNATQVTVKVDVKHIEGNNQYPVFLLSTTSSNAYQTTITNDYMVHAEDYYNVNVGDTVTLEVKGAYCEIVNTNSGNKGWF